MLKYDIVKQETGRILVVKADDLQRYALHDSKDNPLVFKRTGAQAVAITSGTIKVYRKPTGLQFHKEYMLHNGRSLWLGFHPNFERLARNLYEYIKEI
jgi:hypothetical protein